MELRVTTPARGVLVTLDRALELARTRSASDLSIAVLPGVGLSLLALALYYVERVEGIRSLRPLFALAFSAAFVLRAVVLARWASQRVDELLSPYGVTEQSAPASTAARASLWMGVDLWMWSWLLVVAVHLNPWLVPIVLPVLALRGALAPSWLACAGKSQGASGARALRRAIEHAEGQRLLGVGCELLLSLAALGIAFDVGAIATLAVSTSQDLAGLDIALVRAFLSPRNHFALLGLACLSLTLLEPLRGCLSAVLFTDSLLTREGVTARSLVERAVATPRRGAVVRAAVVLAVLTGTGARALAQDGGSEVRVDARVPEERAQADESGELGASTPEEPPCDAACAAERARDAEIGRRVERILNEPAFAEFPDEAWDVDELGRGTVESWLERFFRWLVEREREREPAGGGFELGQLPGATFFVVVAAVVLVAMLVRWLSAPHGQSPRAPAPTVEDDPLARPAEAHLEEARRLADTDLALALRSLYLATLVGLERRSLLKLAPERTNGQYLRDLPPGEERAQFGALTRVFDAVHYGARAPTRDDFEACRRIAERLVQTAEAT